jgi:transposase
MNRRKKQLNLVESERITLRYGSKYHPKPEFREKCQGILLLDSGMTYINISKHLGVNINTVCNWVKVWQSKGIAGFNRKNGQGRKAILSVSNPRHSELLSKFVEANGQNVKAIQAELIKELIVPMSSDTVKRFLKKTIIRSDAFADVAIKGKTK